MSDQERYFIKTMRRLTKSRMGNPRFKFTVVNKLGETRVLHTAPDARWTYAINDGWENRMIEGETHTNSRNIILDFAKIAEKF